MKTSKMSGKFKTFCFHVFPRPKDVSMLKYLEYLNILHLIPGKDIFGPYRFLPLFFIAGGVLEYVMIFWRPRGINFYDTFKRNKSKEIALERFENWKKIEASLKKNESL